MSQLQSPWVESSYGWGFGESGWNSGMDQNILKFSFLFDRNVDSIVSSLPAAVNGKAYYLTVDNRLYFAVGSTYYSTPVPKWFVIVERTTGNTWQFNGVTIVQIQSTATLKARLDAIEITVASLGTAAYHNTEYFATSAQLDITSAQAQTYTDTLRQDLSSTTNGATLIGYAGTTLNKWLDTCIVAPNPTGGDDTVNIQSAINSAAAANIPLIIPPKQYTITPATLVDWEGTGSGGGQMLAGLILRSNLTIRGFGATFKIADNVSTDAAPKNMAMFFTNEHLSNVSIYGLSMDMNGGNNKISPNRATFNFNRFTNAQICVSGTNATTGAARIDKCHIEGCEFKNNAGVSCIVMGQSNTVGADLSTDWKVLFNSFSDVGLDTDDHSSIYGFCIGLQVIGNRLINSSPYNNTTKTGGLCAIEIHGSNSQVAFNVIENYFQGIWVSANFSEAFVHNIDICNNSIRVSGTIVDFWSKNLLPYGEPEGKIQQVSITDNTLEITNDAVAVQVKSFFKLNARQQPGIVSFSKNICRSYAPDCVLSLIVVGTDQRSIADQVNISSNVCSGLTAGLVVFFGGDGATTTTQDVGRVSFVDNDLGYLLPSSVGIMDRDVYLYGPSEGKVESLRLGGLQHPESPVVTDGKVSGRAVVYGKSLIPVPVVWNGITLGNGSTTNKISIDTDAGFATVAVKLTAGSTTVASGSVYPSFTGLVADGTSSAVVTHAKTGSFANIPAVVDATASWVSLYNADGTAFNSSSVTTSSNITVTSNFPCRYASI